MGYGFSLVISSPIVFLFWKYLHNRVDKDPTKGNKVADKTTWLPIVTGIVERFIYTTLIAFSVSGAASFIGSWITIKAIGGWAAWANKDATRYTRSVFVVGLLCSGISALLAIFGGLIVAGFPKP